MECMIVPSGLGRKMVTACRRDRETYSAVAVGLFADDGLTRRRSESAARRRDQMVPFELPEGAF